jgi:uncharacterized membrane protein YjgN (DUF898 family)
MTDHPAVLSTDVTALDPVLSGPPPAGVSRPDDQSQTLQAYRYPIRFTGRGGEYFKIWIVNLLLTIATLGIYSAWAKVRKMQYFYRNTEVDGSVFDYHGKPLAILKGRLIALALILFYNYSFGFSLWLGLIAAAIFAIAWPWLLTQSLRFKLHNTSYRGLRFRFTGSARFLYLMMGIPLAALLLAAGLSAAGIEKGASPNLWMLAPIFVIYAALALLFPWLYFLFKRYQHRHSGYGNAMGRFHGRVRSVYWIFLQALLLGAVVVGILAALVFGTAVGTAIAGQRSSGGWLVAALVGALVVFYALIFSLLPMIQARLQNYIWNNSLLGLLGFDSQARARRMAFIAITNILLIIVTLGFFTPFAAVRMYRYRVESVAVLSTGDLDGFVARESAEVGAAGEGMADLMDFDFSL